MRKSRNLHKKSSYQRDNKSAGGVVINKVAIAALLIGIILSTTRIIKADIWDVIEVTTGIRDIKHLISTVLLIIFSAIVWHGMWIRDHKPSEEKLEKERAYKQQLQEESEAEAVAQKARDEWAKKKAEEPKKPIVGPYANLNVKTQVDNDDPMMDTVFDDE